MRIVPTLVAVLWLSLSVSAAAQDMNEKGGRKGKHPPAQEQKRDDDAKAVKARWCDECKTFVDPKALVEKHRCPRCNHVARKVETEAVKSWLCAHCGRRSAEARDCHGAPAAESPVRAAIVFKCDACGAFETHEGSCPSPECRKMGKMLLRTVELPHEEPSER